MEDACQGYGEFYALIEPLDTYHYGAPHERDLARLREQVHAAARGILRLADERNL